MELRCDCLWGEWLAGVTEWRRHLRQGGECCGEVSDSGECSVVWSAGGHGDEVWEPGESVGDLNGGSGCNPDRVAPIVLECRTRVKTGDAVRGPGSACRGFVVDYNSGAGRRDGMGPEVVCRSMESCVGRDGRVNL